MIVIKIIIALGIFIAGYILGIVGAYGKMAENDLKDSNADDKVN